MQVTVREENSGNFIGQVSVGVDNLTTEQTVEQWFHLMPKEYGWVKLGMLHLKLMFSPNDSMLNIEGCFGVCYFRKLKIEL